MDKLLELLKDVCPDVDFENGKSLVDDGSLSSFDVLSIVAEVTETYDVSIGARDIVPENFNSLEAIWNLIQSRK